MNDPVEAARDLLRCTRPPVEEWRLEQEIREASSSETSVPSRREVLLEDLDALTGCDGLIEENVEEVIQLVSGWRDEDLEEIRSRIRELAESVVTGGESRSE